MSSGGKSSVRRRYPELPGVQGPSRCFRRAEDGIHADAFTAFRDFLLPTSLCVLVLVLEQCGNQNICFGEFFLFLIETEHHEVFTKQMIQVKSLHFLCKKNILH